MRHKIGIICYVIAGLLLLDVCEFAFIDFKDISDSFMLKIFLLSLCTILALIFLVCGALLRKKLHSWKKEIGFVFTFVSAFSLANFLIVMCYYYSPYWQKLTGSLTQQMTVNYPFGFGTLILFGLIGIYLLK